MANRYERLLVMDELICKGRYPSVQDFCELFEVKERIVYADLSYLRDFMRRDFHFDRSKRGYVLKGEPVKLPQFDLTNGEVFALTLGKEMLSQYTGTSFEGILRRAIEKISERLPERVKVDLDDVRCMVKFNPVGIIPISRKMFFELNKACEKQQPVALVYTAASTGETTSRVVYPYRLLESRGTWYLVAYCNMRRDYRFFALHRIEDHQLLDERFQPPEGFDIDAWIKSAFQLEHKEKDQSVKVRFGPLAARYIRERKWHHTQTLTEHDDGSCTLEFVTQSLDETKRWVLTYGAEAEVLEPSSLREMVMKEFEEARKIYAGATSS